MTSYDQIFSRAFTGGHELRLFVVRDVQYVGFKKTNLYELVFLEWNGPGEGYNAVCTEHYRLDQPELAYIAFEIRAVSENPWQPTQYQKPLECVIPECRMAMPPIY